MKHLALCIGSSLTVSLLLFAGISRASDYDEAIMLDFLGNCIYKGVGVAPPAYMSAWCHCSRKGVKSDIPFSEYEKLDEANLKENPAVIPILYKSAGIVEPYLQLFRQRAKQS